MSGQSRQLHLRTNAAVASTSNSSNQQNGVAAVNINTAVPRSIPVGHNASTPSFLAHTTSAESQHPPPQRSLQPTSQAVDLAAMQEQYRKWKDNFHRSHQSNAATVLATPRLTQLYLDVLKQHTQGSSTMPVSDPPQSQRQAAGIHSTDAKFWNAVSKLSPDVQREIFKELRAGGEEVITSARNLNRSAGQLSSPALTATANAPAVASIPSIAAPQQMIRQAVPSRPPPPARADHSVLGSLIPPGFATHPRFVPYQVNEYSFRYTDKCRRFIPPLDNNPTSQDKWAKFNQPRDTRAAEEMLRPLASGVGRIIGGVVGADLIDREASAFVQAILTLQKHQEAAEARAARAEAKMAAMERQMYVLQELLQTNSTVPIPDGSGKSSSSHAQEVAQLHQQIIVLYRHQKSLETRVNAMDKSSDAGSREGSSLGDTAAVVAQSGRVEVGGQQVYDAVQQTDGQTSSERHHRSLSATSASSRRSGNQGLLQLVATELERSNEEIDAPAPEGGNIPAQDSGVGLTAAVKAEDEADELTSDREDTPLTSQSPPAVSPPDQRFQQQFGTGRADGAASDSAPKPITTITTNAKPLKRKRPSSLQTSFIIIDSSDEER